MIILTVSIMLLRIILIMIMTSTVYNHLCSCVQASSLERLASADEVHVNLVRVP